MPSSGRHASKAYLEGLLKGLHSPSSLGEMGRVGLGDAPPLLACPQLVRNVREREFPNHTLVWAGSQGWGDFYSLLYRVVATEASAAWVPVSCLSCVTFLDQ